MLSCSLWDDTSLSVSIADYPRAVLSAIIRSSIGSNQQHLGKRPFDQRAGVGMVTGGAGAGRAWWMLRLASPMSERGVPCDGRKGRRRGRRD